MKAKRRCLGCKVILKDQKNLRKRYCSNECFANSYRNRSFRPQRRVLCGRIIDLGDLEAI